MVFQSDIRDLYEIFLFEDECSRIVASMPVNRFLQGARFDLKAHFARDHFSRLSNHPRLHATLHF